MTISQELLCWHTHTYIPTPTNRCYWKQYHLRRW